MLDGSPYQAYTYSYPHKSAYRVLESPIPLTQAWEREDKRALFLYLHVPFCEYRCGFCNLFTQANPEVGLTTRYLNQLECEASVVGESLGKGAHFAQIAIGGGTPTFLNRAELQRLLQISSSIGADCRRLPLSVEVSPATLDHDKLNLLAEYQTDRISIGIQSFREDEARRLGRPQKAADVHKALSGIRRVGFPVLNIDLIYGGEGQSVSDWLACVQEAIRWNPEELYLYPLYVRPLTGLGRLDHSWDDQRLEAYREARDVLLGSGYEQTSMRMFRRSSAGMANRDPAGRSSGEHQYQCQDDGMIGLGCGARSYTTQLHYSTEFAVGRQGVRGILSDYLNRKTDSFAQAHYGIQLSLDDQKRRFVILSLLQTCGLSRNHYQQRFRSDVIIDFPQLNSLVEHALAQMSAEYLRLTPQGIERSDAIGPWLYSSHIRGLMQSFELV